MIATTSSKNGALVGALKIAGPGRRGVVLPFHCREGAARARPLAGVSTQERGRRLHPRKDTGLGRLGVVPVHPELARQAGALTQERDRQGASALERSRQGPSTQEKRRPPSPRENPAGRLHPRETPAGPGQGPSTQREGPAPSWPSGQRVDARTPPQRLGRRPGAGFGCGATRSRASSSGRPPAAAARRAGCRRAPRPLRVAARGPGGRTASSWPASRGRASP
jgi:hypothetical protein